MGKTLLATLVLFGAVLYLSVWIQIVLFVCAVLFFRFRVLFLLPAMVADALYAPARTLLPGDNRMTLIVGGMIVLWVVIMNTTRLRERYGVETA